MFNLEMKKISIIAGAVASAITLSAFSGFAAGPPTESLSEQSIGASDEVSLLDEQTIDNLIGASGDFVSQETTKPSLPKSIKLNTPGDYRLVGIGASISNNQDSNVIVVNTQDRVVIDGDGKYNIILDNVNITLWDEIEGFCTPLKIRNYAIVNLTLIGKNTLKNFIDGHNSLDTDYTSCLAITGLGEGASLDVHGDVCGIWGRKVIINGGNIKASGYSGSGINGREIIINGGNIQSTSQRDDAIESDGTLTINGGDIKATSENRSAIYSDEIIIVNGGNIQATSNNKSAIYSDEIIIVNGGNIQATSDNSDAIESDEIIIVNGGDIKATSENGSAIYSGEITINSGNIKATSENGSAIYSEEITINDGKIQATSNNKSAIYSDEITIKGGDISKIKSINGIKYDFENSEYMLPFYAVDAKEKYVEEKNNILENLWGVLKKSNESVKTNNCFSDCQFIFNSEN